MVVGMGITHWLLGTIVSAVSLCGQGIQVLDCRDAFLALEAARDNPVGKGRLLDRFVAFLTVMEQENSAQKRDHRILQKVGEDRVALQVQAATLASAQAMITQLRKGTVATASLQGSIVTMPADVAKEQGLMPRKWTAMDSGEFGKLVRAAAAAKGKLQNLPEVRLAPLESCTIEPKPRPKPQPRRGAKVEAQKQPEVVSDPMALRVVAEMMPVSDTEVAMDLYVARGEPPKGASGPRFYALAAKMVRMEVGSGFAVSIEDGDQAIVIYVRCAEVAWGKLSAVQPAQAVESTPATAPAGKK
jgi:hypothetical protein